jgi:hypothetical protein
MKEDFDEHKSGQFRLRANKLLNRVVKAKLEDLACHRNEYLHGRARTDIPPDARLMARCLAREIVCALVDKAGGEPDRKGFLRMLVS